VKESLQKRSVAARNVEGFQSLPVHARVYPRVELTIPAFDFLNNAGPHLLSPKGWKVESAQESYVTAITVDSCSNRHASLANFSTGGLNVELTTSRSTSLDANH